MSDLGRLFFGFEVNAPWPEQLPEGRLLQEGQRHITVAFLGESSCEKIMDLIPKMPKPFFKAGTIGTFEACLFLPEIHPRVVAWKGLPLGADRLTAYSNQLNTFLREKGYPIQEHDFLNHTTLARSPFNKKEWDDAFISLPYTTRHLHLYESLGDLNYKPIWSYEQADPFEEFEHIADIAFRIHGEDIQQLYYNAQIALAFECPELVPFLNRQSEVHTLEEIIINLNELVTHGDREFGTPFKAVSFHGDLKGEDILTWEMIVDV